MAHGQEKCASCGALMPAGFKFCGQCGSELGE